MARTRNRTPKKDWAKAFLKELAWTASVLHSARKIGKGRRTVYDRRESDPEFAAAWDEAIELANDFLLVEARRRAVEGTLEPVFQGGRLRGKVRKYSDTLLIFLIKARNPEFRDNGRIEHTGAGRGPIQHDVVTLTAADILAARELVGVAFGGLLRDGGCEPTLVPTVGQTGPQLAG